MPGSDQVIEFWRAQIVRASTLGFSRPMLVFIRRRIVIPALALAAVGAFAAPRAGHVFIISIDGGKPAVMQNSVMPTLQELVREGAHSWAAQTIFPSITLPSHASMLTGVGPDKHQISWNNWLPGAGFVKVPTVFSEAKKGGAATAMFVGKEKMRHLSLPGTVDEFSYAAGKQEEIIKEAGTTKKDGKAKVVKEGTVKAAVVAAEAAAYIVARKPQLCFIHFPDPDSVGHKYGWGTPEQLEAFAEADSALAVVKAAIEKAGIAATSVMIISADHGGHDKTHGSNSPDDMTIPWIVWGQGVKRGFTITAPVTTYDTAATALWLLDRPIPESFDGKPVVSAFEFR
jgi:predicted AlkP superfamily pyrophosphatase or phosphodiesterase